MSEPRRRTFTEQARRRQIVDCTIALLAEQGQAGTSLSGIAARAGVSKAAVLYHFSSKDAVLAAVLEHVLDGFVGAVGELVEHAEGPEQQLIGYLRGAIGHFHRHPGHAAVLAEVLRREHGGPDEPDGLGPGTSGGAARWQVVADILTAGQDAGVFRRADPRTLALVIGGALDGVVAESLVDPAYDLGEAGRELEAAVLAAVRT